MHPRAIRNQHKPSLKRQQGVVIVVALFIVALVAGLAYEMLARTDRDIYRANLILHNTQAQFYAQASVIWAIDQLRNDWIKQKANHLIDENPIKSPENVMNGYHISSTITDMQDKFNLNNLITPESQIDFVHLLHAIDPAMSEDKAQELVQALVDWMAPGQINDKNPLSQYYLELPSPYRPAHRALVNVSEIKLVKGITPRLYEALKPYIAVLPNATVINVQTAAIPVLVSLSKTMTDGTAKALIQQRQQKPFTSLTDFMNFDIVKNHGISAEKITLTSSYFLVTTNVTIESQHLRLYTLLERNAHDSNATVRILWQSQ